MSARLRSAAAVAACATLLALSGAAGAFAAALAEQAPKGVSLAGSWRLDAPRSDDAQAVLDTLRKALDGQKPPRGRFSRAQHRTDRDGIEDESGERLFRELAMDAQREQRSRQMERYTEILRNPPLILVQQDLESINFVADYDRLECVPGEEVAVTDSAGTARRSCGWSGAALLVQQKGQRGSLVERRYEIGAGGAELIYTTTLGAQQLPPVKLRRVYRRDGLSASAPPAAAQPAGRQDAGASPAR